ncbi:MAG: patatin-like phospholipase family protein [Gemmatimonadetes bacterium]|nr:patatin-like phospholipase family protein [Gemmatimonadota bacterium]
MLDSLGVRPDFVVGTSMGSIVGAMYASGYSAAQIASLADSLGLAELFTNADQRTPRALGDRRPLVVWEQGTGGFRVAQSIARETGVNAALNRALLRGNLFARGSFDSLPIPFRAVATDLRTPRRGGPRERRPGPRGAGQHGHPAGVRPGAHRGAAAGGRRPRRQRPDRRGAGPGARRGSSSPT